MIRAAAKNYLRIASVSSPAQYAALLAELRGSGRRDEPRDAQAARRRGLRPRLALRRDRLRAGSGGLDRRRRLAARLTELESESWPRTFRRLQDDHRRSLSPAHGDRLRRAEGGERQPSSTTRSSTRSRASAKGLRYGENPDQAAALYKPVGGNLALGGALLLEPGEGLVSAAELLQFGKHPGKTNLTDVDSALALLRYLSAKPRLRHHEAQQPLGPRLRLHAARRPTTRPTWPTAWRPSAARSCSTGRSTSRRRREISSSYCEVVAAPDYAAGALELLASRKNLRIMRIPAMERLEAWALRPVLDFKALLDGSLVVQTSFVSRIALARGLPSRRVRAGGQRLRGRARAHRGRVGGHALRLERRDGHHEQLGHLREGRRHGRHRHGRAGPRRRRRDRPRQGLPQARGPPALGAHGRGLERVDGRGGQGRGARGGRGLARRASAAR